MNAPEEHTSERDIEIQYAVLAEHIDMSANPARLTNVITEVSIRKEDSVTKFRWPLYVTFTRGPYGKHPLTVLVISPNEKFVANTQFYFDWPRGELVHAEVFDVEFEFDGFGHYHFMVLVNGPVLCQWVVPITEDGHLHE